jgi:6,7-dimethyl-8-ribityllumazine synthase
MQGDVQRGTFETFDASDYKVGIVAAQFNLDVIDGLLGSAQEKLSEYNVSEKNIDLFKVPGAVEIPVIAQKLAETKKYDCLIVIGAVIRGATPHFDFVAGTVTDGVLRVQLDHTLPIGFGVLTLETPDQAPPRYHVGADAVVAAMNSAKIIREL